MFVSFILFPVNVHMPKDRITQLHQGYGFVEFLGEEDADYAIKVMNMIKVYGKPIRVNKVCLMSLFLFPVNKNDNNNNNNNNNVPKLHNLIWKQTMDEEPLCWCATSLIFYYITFFFEHELKYWKKKTHHIQCQPCLSYWEGSLQVVPGRTWILLHVHTVPPGTIDPLVRGQTSAPRSICAAKSPRWDEFLNLVLAECDRTPRQAWRGMPRWRNNSN